MAKALGYSHRPAGRLVEADRRAGASVDRPATEPRHPRRRWSTWPSELLKAPRHLGIHSGGMVLTERPVGEVCPIERGRMDDRTVLQWDKDDCAWMGLVKFDLLGLGMLGALAVHASTWSRDQLGEQWDARTRCPRRSRASTTCSAGPTRSGCSRSRAGPRSARCRGCSRGEFYDLVIEIALIRPGPIQGGAVHPYIRAQPGRRRSPTCTRRSKPVLERTLGVPLFQEQLMQMAMAVGDCTGDDADLLRRAMGSKRGVEKIESLQRRSSTRAWRRNGITGDAGRRRSTRKIQAFANFGFAESHAHQLRAAGLRELVAQAALPGGVPGRAAARPADGLLLAAVAGGRRPPARRRGAPPRHPALRA